MQGHSLLLERAEPWALCFQISAWKHLIPSLCIWLHKVQWEPCKRQVKDSDQWHRHQALRSHNTWTSKQMAGQKIPVLMSDFSPSSGVNKVHQHQPNTKSRPMPELKHQVSLRSFHKYCINAFFSIWSTRSLNQATITQSASICCRQRAGMLFSRQVTRTSKGGITKLCNPSLSSEPHWASSFPGETKPWVPEAKLCSFVYTWHSIYYIKSTELQ